MTQTSAFNLTSKTSHVPHHMTNFWVTWAATVPMVTISVTALAANGTVLLMFALRPSLRRGKNAYLASLALADFFIGLYMPLVTLEEVGLFSVPPGPWCKVYLTVRYILLYVSLLSVLFITLDRWWSVRWPFSYRARHTRRLAASIVSALWAFSVAVYALPIFLWGEDTSLSLSLILAGNNGAGGGGGGGGGAGGNTNGGGLDGRTSPGVGGQPHSSSSLLSSSSAHRQQHHYASTNDQHHSDGSRVVSPQDLRFVHLECEVPYVLSFTWWAVTCCVLYLLPLVAMWIINCSLYHKIRQRRSVEIRRSTSVTDTFFVTVKPSKPTIQITEAPSLVGPPSCMDMPAPSSPLMSMRNSSPTRSLGNLPGSGGSGSGRCSPTHMQGNNLHPGYVTPNMGRRHSSAIVSNIPSPQLDVRRNLSQRRVSLPDWALRGDCSPPAGTTSNQCRYVGRKWSGCGSTTSITGQGGGGGGLGLGLGMGLGSSTGLFGSNSGALFGDGTGTPRPPGEDLVHELLVKQDQKAACCLGLLLAACTLCWLPFATLALVRAHCPLCIGPVALAVCRWLLMANSAVNPFLYGLLNAQFRNILRQWFYLDASRRRYRPAKDTYIYMGVAKAECDGHPSNCKETSNVCLSLKVP